MRQMLFSVTSLKFEKMSLKPISFFGFIFQFETGKKKCKQKIVKSEELHDLKRNFFLKKDKDLNEFGSLRIKMCTDDNLKNTNSFQGNNFETTSNYSKTNVILLCNCEANFQETVRIRCTNCGWYTQLGF
jgi:hypothetical protein